MSTTAMRNPRRRAARRRAIAAATLTQQNALSFLSYLVERGRIGEDATDPKILVADVTDVKGGVPLTVAMVTALGGSPVGINRPGTRQRVLFTAPPAVRRAINTAGTVPRLPAADPAAVTEV